MPHESSPDAISETALLSEYWDAVLDYANLCTTSPQNGMRLATEAFRRGIRETRTSRTRAWGPRLPWLPLLLSSVRKTAADWQARQAGDRLDPALRIWLTSDRARRYATPRREQPLALRGLCDLPEVDADLLWSVEVESQSLTTVARRLGWDSAYADEEIARVRARFRELCQRNHVDTLNDEECRSYAGLLDAATRSPDAAAPEDLWQHLARCVHCKEAAACLYLHGSGLPGALAGGVLGWGGLPYLERRRRVAAEHTGGKRLQTLARSVGPPLWDRVKGIRGGRGKSRTGRATGVAGAGVAAGARGLRGRPRRPVRPMRPVMPMGLMRVMGLMGPTRRVWTTPSTRSTRSARSPVPRTRRTRSTGSRRSTPSARPVPPTRSPPPARPTRPVRPVRPAPSAPPPRSARRPRPG
ncbi:cellulose-binding protein [Streptomyces sp. FXJ1.4098]|nr:cellulose-binding protein [Streptomyces sp. FXJ1.4098]